MMRRIHPSAVVEDGAKLGAGVEIGPFCHIGPHVTIGDGVRLVSHVSHRRGYDGWRADADFPIRLDRP